MVKFLYVLTLLGAVVGAGDFLLGLVAANSAPQQAAGAAMALAWAVIPYVFARAAEKLNAPVQKPSSAGTENAGP